MPDTVLAHVPLHPTTARRRRRRPKGPGEQTRVREILSYLAAALPASTSAAARLLALQCALRVNGRRRARRATARPGRTRRAVFSLNRIVADVPAGEPFFSARLPDVGRLTFAEAARWVVHVHAYDTSGIKTGD